MGKHSTRAAQDLDAKNEEKQSSLVKSFWGKGWEGNKFSPRLWTQVLNAFDLFSEYIMLIECCIAILSFTLRIYKFCTILQL